MTVFKFSKRRPKKKERGDKERVGWRGGQRTQGQRERREERGKGKKRGGGQGVRNRKGEMDKEIAGGEGERNKERGGEGARDKEIGGGEGQRKSEERGRERGGETDRQTDSFQDRVKIGLVAFPGGAIRKQVWLVKVSVELLVY